MNLELTNLNAVVCGSTQGIGLATAEVLAKLGANIYLLACLLFTDLANNNAILNH